MNAEPSAESLNLCPNKKTKMKGKITRRGKKKDVSNNPNKNECVTNVKLKKDIQKSDQKALQKKQSKSCESSDETEWEDFDELSQIFSDDKEKSKLKNVQIEIQDSNHVHDIRKSKCQTREELIMEAIRRQMNSNIKKICENKHKTHILCLIAHGQLINKCLQTKELLGCALSVVQNSCFLVKKKIGIADVKNLMMKFRKIIRFKPEDFQEKDYCVPLDYLLIGRFSNCIALSERELVFMFILVCRSLGLQTRFVQNISPVSWKPKPNEIVKQKKTKPQAICVENDEFTDKSNKVPLKKSKNNTASEIIHDPDFCESSVKWNKKNVSKSKCCNKNTTSSLMEWIEVYICNEKKWISVDINEKELYTNFTEMAKHFPHSGYIIAHNEDFTIRDVTKRYISNWLSEERKLRFDSKWWRDTLSPYIGSRSKLDEIEEKEMNETLRLQPIPTTLAGLKNHPLFVLKRHLLKYQAIYPPDEPPVGYLKDEPIFPRESVKTLRGRDNWLKEAKTVIVSEEPYKIVKAMPKWDKINKRVIKDCPLELFGEWQVEDYNPPVAKNGKVPRNEFGNVDLFKPCMLPKGCVHLTDLPGLYRLSRKLDIDCAQAVVGFDFSSHGSIPVTDGFVVCEENEEILREAWQQDQIHQIEKREEKRIKLIYSNWKKLILGMLIKERIKEKYGQSEQKFPPKIIPEKKKVKTTPSSISKCNLSIDTQSSAADLCKRKLGEETNDFMVSKKKRRNENEEVESVVKCSDASDSDEGDLEEEKKLRIQNILKWQPSCSTSVMALSDNSDDE